MAVSSAPVEGYHRMGEAGILSEDDRVELLQGEIVEMALISRRHFAFFTASRFGTFGVLP